jgi:putative ABC transport system permease protein
MFKNFLKVACRNLIRNKGFSAINIAGLTLGLTACLLIGLFVWDEKQYDQFLPDADQVYRVYNERTDNEGVSNTPRTPPMFATTLQRQFPEVEKAMRMMDLQSKNLFEAGDKKIYEEGGLAAEPTFFDIFPLSFKYGSARKVLDDPNSVVLTDALAVKYFGHTDPVGKQLIIDKEPFLVKGVLKNTTDKFHLRLNYIIPVAHVLTAAKIPAKRMESWGWSQFYTYVKLKKGAQSAPLLAKFRDVIREKALPELKQGGSTYMPYLQPLKDVHLHSSDFKMDIAVKGNITYVKALTIIAVFILLIACFNFVNLATAKSLQRAKEVGVRKSIGASRKQLVLQYTGEAVLLLLISVLISLTLVTLFLPSLNHFTDKHIGTADLYNPVFLSVLLVSTLAVGVAAGFYPAWILSGFQPAKVLKSAPAGSGKPGQIPWLRHGLVVIQFTLSTLLIISAIIVFRQVNYLHNKDLGLNKEQILFFPMHDDNMFKNYAAFKNELTKSPGVSSASIGYGFPGDIFAGDDIIVPHGNEQKTFPVTQLLVDDDYVKTLGLQIVAGRDFSKDITTDKDEAFIINETAVKELGYGTPEKALGQPLQWKVWDSKTPDSLKKGRIIGIVKDFHYKSLYDKLTAAVLQIYPPAYWKVAVKMKTANLANTVADVKNAWNKYSPDFPIEYKFLDDNFDQMYRAEDKLRSLLYLFTGIAIFVGCLGLLGLAAFAAQRRTKEIGIRKVLGASMQRLVLMLSTDFLKLVVIALVIASPIAWYFMNKWLQDFAYRINIDWWIFAVAGLLSMLIAFLTVGFQAVKGAKANPVKSLRSE